MKKLLLVTLFFAGCGTSSPGGWEVMTNEVASLKQKVADLEKRETDLTELTQRNIGISEKLQARVQKLEEKP
jgi:hypothetical protein